MQHYAYTDYGRAIGFDLGIGRFIDDNINDIADEFVDSTFRWIGNAKKVWYEATGWEWAASSRNIGEIE